MLSDFSTSLLRATDIDKERKNDKGNLSESFNLNRVLLKIRDNGSAYGDAVKQDARKENRATLDAKIYKKRESNSEENNKNSDSYKIADDELHLTSKKIPDGKLLDGKLLHYITRTQIASLIAFSAIAVGVMMYMINSRVDSAIPNTVKSISGIYPVINQNSDEKMAGDIFRAPSLIEADLRTADLKLLDFKKSSEIKLMNTLPTGSLSTVMLPEGSNELALITSSVSVLTNEIRTLRKELKQVRETIVLEEVKTKIAATNPERINDDKAVKKRTVKKLAFKKSDALIEKPENKVIVSDKKAKLVHKKTVADIKLNQSKSEIAVNLVSLSNKAKTNELIKKINATGLSPHLEEAMVNDTQVYRISVSGFEDKEKAVLFIQNAADDFGVKGSRIISK